MTDEQPYERTMSKSDQILGFQLFVRDWTVKEIATEIDRAEGTVRLWIKNFGWKLRKKVELRSIEDEMRTKTLEMRNDMLDIGKYALDDVFIKDSTGKVVGVGIQVEKISDLESLSRMVLKVGGVPDKVETKVEKTVDVTGEIKVETVTPEMAAEIGKMIAIQESEAVDDGNTE